VKSLITLLIVFLISSICFSQQQNAAAFSIEITQVNNATPPYLQSFVTASQNGQWLLIGGRTNGLHGFPGTAFDPPSFPAKYQNRYISVYDPVTDSLWIRSVYKDLPLSIADQLSSTNAESFQNGNTLYIVGGYGKDSLLSLSNKDSLVTFNKLTAINISKVINAVKTNSSIAPFIRQYADSRMEVTGGALKMIGADFYLVGGQLFSGQYITPSTAIQKYTNQIRKFDIADDGVNLSITNYSASTDTLNLHRRDLNVAPIISSQSGEEGLAVYGGVFKNDVTTWNNPLYISSKGFSMDSHFEQRFSQYTCPVISLYDSVSNKMSSLLMGGLSLYRFDKTLNKAVIDSCDLGEGLVPCIPYITDISVISKFADGSTRDSVLSVTYPGGLLIGTNAEIFLDKNLPVYDNGVIKYDNLKTRTFIGYIYGGIESPASNPGDLQTTSASNKIFKIYLTPGNITGVTASKSYLPGKFQLYQNYPNPFNPTTIIQYTIPATTRSGGSRISTLKVYDILGREVATLVNEEKSSGTYEVKFDGSKLGSGVYFYRMQAGGFDETKKLILIK